MGAGLMICMRAGNKWVRSLPTVDWAASLKPTRLLQISLPDVKNKSIIHILLKITVSVLHLCGNSFYFSKQKEGACSLCMEVISLWSE